MACCLCFFQGTKTLLALLVLVIGLFARFSTGHGTLLICITCFALLIFLSAIFLFTCTRQMVAGNELSPQEEHQQAMQENPVIDSSRDDLGAIPTVGVGAETDMKKPDYEQVLIASQDFYSESESMDQFSSSTCSELDHSSDLEWPYDNMTRRLDCSDDGSISDEESLIEIAIPTGQFVSPEKDSSLKNLKCCKLSEDFSDQETIFHHRGFWADNSEMNEDNLIEIDIFMGSIKCSTFEI